MISTQAYAYAPGGATVFVRRGRVDEALVIRGAYFELLLICGELVAAAPRETFFTKQVVVKGKRAACGTAFCAAARATADLGLEDCVVACPGGVGVDASAALILKRSLVGHARTASSRAGAGRAGTTVRHCANVGLDAAGVGRPGARL